MNRAFWYTPIQSSIYCYNLLDSVFTCKLNSAFQSVSQGWSLTRAYKNKEKDQLKVPRDGYGCLKDWSQVKSLTVSINVNRVL